MKGLTTNRQKELLHFICEYIAENSYSPTLEEMRNYLDVVSNQAVLDLLKKLENQNLIRKDASISRSISVFQKGYKIIGKNPPIAVLGTTSAGAPMEAVEISGEWITSPTSDVAAFKDNVFLLKVSGDSMIGAGIDDGDLVLVQEQKQFISGDIVLAQIRDESTIKRFVSEDKAPYVYLKPENPKYKIIPFTDETMLKGKVISVLKNGYWNKIK